MAIFRFLLKLALVGALVVAGVFVVGHLLQKQPDDPKQAALKKCRSQLRQLDIALNGYRIKYGVFPDRLYEVVEESMCADEKLIGCPATDQPSEHYTYHGPGDPRTPPEAQALLSCGRHKGVKKGGSTISFLVLYGNGMLKNLPERPVISAK
jgi:hypothetical protein